MRIASRLAVLLVLFPAGGAGAEIVNRVVLRVNSEIATLSEYELRRDNRIEEIAQAGDLPLDDRRQLVAEAGRATMREIFDELLAVSRARQLRITVPPGRLDRAVEAQRQRFGLEDPGQFEDALRQSGMTLRDFRRRMERTLLLDEVLEREVRSRIQVGDEEVSRYWREHAERFLRPEQRRIEEVVVREDSELSRAEREELAGSIAARAASGEELAALVEDAPEGALAGPIDHGWVERGTLVEELDEVAWGLEPGEASAPVRARGGLHVLRVAEIRPAATLPLEEVAGQIQLELGAQRFEQRTREWVEQLARTAYVVENLPEEAVGYRDAVEGEIDPLRQLLAGPGPAAVAPEPAPEPAPEAEGEEAGP